MKEKPVDKKTYIIFYSIDIIDSTSLKLIRQQERWNIDINRVDSDFKQYLRKEEVSVKYWKFLGDEWIFTQTVGDATAIKSGYAQFETLISKIITYFPIRSKIWIIVNDRKELCKLDTQDNYNEEISIKDKDIEKDIYEDNDWISHSLDIGFRFGKYIYPYFIALSPEIAYLYSKLAFQEFDFFVSEERELKGLSFPYPNISINYKKNDIKFDDNYYKYKTKLPKQTSIKNKNILSYTKKYIQQYWGYGKLGKFNEIFQ